MKVVRRSVVALYVYPIKGARGIAVDRIEVTGQGAVGDRSWMIVDADWKFVSQRTVPHMTRLLARPTDDGGLLLAWDTPDGSDSGLQPLRVPPVDGYERPLDVFGRAVTGIDAGDEAAEWLSGALGFRARLVGLPEAPGQYVDAAPLLVTTTASLEDLEAGIAGGISGGPSMARFRPNIVVRTDEPWEEDQWTHLEVDGGVRFRLVKPCIRCSVPGVDQLTGLRSKEPLAALGRQRRVDGGVAFGVYVELDVPSRPKGSPDSAGSTGPGGLRMTVIKV